MTRANDETFFKNRQVASIATVIDAVTPFVCWINASGVWQLLARVLAVIGWYLLIMAAYMTDQQLFPHDNILLESSRSFIRKIYTGAALLGVTAPWWMQWLRNISR